MHSSLSKLLDIAGPPLGEKPPVLSSELAEVAGPGSNTLSNLLRLKNGFFAFECALHVLPSGPIDAGISLESWNDESLWRAEYGGFAQDLLFFAEDLFGGQFGIQHGKIYRLDPETGELDEFAPDVDGWAGRILKDFDFETGFRLAHAWQIQHGPIRAGERLLPKKPFVLGGQYEIENLYNVEAVKGMRFRAGIARQLRDVPDGATVKIKLID